MKKRSYRLLSMLLAALLVIGLLPAMAFATLADGEPYTGDEVTFLYMKDGNETEFGMFARQDGTTCEIKGDKVIIHYMPKNLTVYAGLHWGTTADKPFSKDSIDVELKDKALDIELDKTCCGTLVQAVAIKEVKETDEDGKETGKVTYSASSQLYLAIPSEEKIKASQSSGETPEEPETPEQPGGLPAGATALSVYDEENMFKVVNAYLMTVDGKEYLFMALNSTGYEYLFAGTYEEAMANGGNRDNWIKYKEAAVEVDYETAKDGKVKEEGLKNKFQFAIPVTLNQSGETKIPIVSISASKLKEALEKDPDNPDYSEVFFGRQALIDIDNKTIRTGNYKETASVTVTSEATHFQIDSKYESSLYIEGSPNANTFKSYLTFKMGDETYTKAYLGTAAEAKKNASKAVAIKDGVFELDFCNIRGEAAMITDGKATAAFYVAKDAAFDEAGKWVERTFVFDYENKTVTVEGKALHATKKLEYDGDKVTFVKADLKSGFGMWAAQDGSTFELKGDKVIIHNVPKNAKTYVGMHYGPIDDAKLSKDVTFTNGIVDLELDADTYCGYATAIAPLKKDGKSTAAQYYLAVPAVAEHDKSVSVAGIKTEDGSQLPYTEDLIFKFNALTLAEAVSINPNVSSEKDIQILWQKDITVVTEEPAAKGSSDDASPVTLSFEVSGLEAEQEIYVYHCVDGKWTYVTAGKGGKVDAQFDSFSPVALAVSNPQIPKTGDSSNILLWTALAVCSLAAAAVVIRRRREEF